MIRLQKLTKADSFGQIYYILNIVKFPQKKASVENKIFNRCFFLRSYASRCTSLVVNTTIQSTIIGECIVRSLTFPKHKIFVLNYDR